MSNVGSRPIIFTLSGKAGAGKDTIGIMIKKYLQELDMQALSISYADYLKTICARNFGFTDKSTQRKLLQEFGTRVRELEPDFWVLTVFHTFDVLRDDFDAFVVSDARYKNELQPFPYNCYYPIVNIFVKRDINNGLSDDELKHESEELAIHPNFDEDFHYVIDNNGTLEETYSQVCEVVNDVLMLKTKFIHDSMELSEDMIKQLMESMDKVGGNGDFDA